MIRVDNGPEFISEKLDAWCKSNNITLIFIQPWKPIKESLEAFELKHQASHFRYKIDYTVSFR